MGSCALCGGKAVMTEEQLAAFLAQKQGALTMDATLISVKLVNVSLPQQITLPIHISNRLGLPRRYNIERRDTKLPRAVVDWMKTDRRYFPWFAPVAGDSPAVAEVSKVAEAVTVNPTDQWSPKWRFPDLAAYARAHEKIVPFGMTKATLIEMLRDELSPSLEAK